MTNDIKTKHLIEFLMTVLNSNIRCDARTHERALHTGYLCYRECVMLPLLCIASTQLYACDLALRRSQLLDTDSRVFPVKLGKTFFRALSERSQKLRMSAKTDVIILLNSQSFITNPS